jgi:hypothetical protein
MKQSVYILKDHRQVIPKNLLESGVGICRATDWNPEGFFTKLNKRSVSNHVARNILFEFSISYELEQGHQICES